MQTIKVFEYSVSKTTLKESVDWAYAQTDRQSPKLVAVINANKMWLAARNQEIEQFLHQADVVLPEYAICWAAQQLGNPTIEPVYGVEFCQHLINQAIKLGKRPFLLGGKPGVTEQIANQFAQQYPNLHLAGHHHGYLNSIDLENQVIKMIRASAADILIIGMGSPLQEQWMIKHSKAVNVPVMVGIGGSLDILSGIKKDTPSYIRGTGWEWLYRLSLDPKQYWKRYLITNPWFIWKVIQARWHTDNN